MNTQNDPNIIQLTDNIMIIDNKGYMNILNIKKDETYKIKKKKISLKDLVGHPFDSKFELDAQGQLIKVEKEEDLLEMLENQEAGPAEDDSDKDSDDAQEPSNREMFDNNNAQKLKESAIDEMKKEGMAGKEIIEKIVVNSDTFNKRTVYSKEKYLKKKRQKHLIQFRVQKITLTNIAELYYIKNSSYIMHMRFDSLALFLQNAAIEPGSKVLLFENTHGLVLSGIKQKMLNNGEIYVCSTRIQRPDKKEFKIFNEMGFKDEDLANVHFVSLEDLETMNHTDFSQLLIASEVQAEDILAKTVNYIQGSANIVIFSQFLEALSDCFSFFKKNGQAINIRIKEIFTRECQVLPNRTHPFMNMQAFSGFVMSANKVIN